MLISWHIHMIEAVQKRTGLSNYQILWIAFIEGLIIGILLGWWLL